MHPRVFPCWVSLASRLVVLNMYRASNACNGIIHLYSMLLLLIFMECVNKYIGILFLAVTCVCLHMYVG